MTASQQASVSSAVERLAEKIVSQRLELPALLALEMHLPMTSIFHTTSLFFEPLMSPIFGLERFTQVTNFLSDRENVRSLIERVRELSEERV